jgi:hypothetical protein
MLGLRGLSLSTYPGDRQEFRFQYYIHEVGDKVDNPRLCYNGRNAKMGRGLNMPHILGVRVERREIVHFINIFTVRFDHFLGVSATTNG